MMDPETYFQTPEGMPKSTVDAFRSTVNRTIETARENVTT